MRSEASRIGTAKWATAWICAAAFTTASQAGLSNGEGIVGGNPYVPGSGWEMFTWNDGPGVFNNEGAFTFTLVDGPLRLLKVTDAFIDGDQFEVYDFDVLILTTSFPTDTGSRISNDYDAAFANPMWSSGSIILGVGDHSITFKTIATATGFPNGGAAFEVDIIPAPSALLPVVFGTLLFVRRRRR